VAHREAAGGIGGQACGEQGAADGVWIGVAGNRDRDQPGEAAEREGDAQIGRVGDDVSFGVRTVYG
jgi:hypothetical protein